MLTRVLFAAALVLTMAGTCQAQETAAVALGLADHKVSEDELAKGETPSAPKFNTPGVAYAWIAHPKKGDTIEVSLMKDGKPLMANTREVEADDSDVLLQAGKTGVPAGGWPGGTYSASVKIARDGKAILEQTSEPLSFE
ncbi:MAG TPA: hypothetical protein VMW57_03665 [Methyloceanibacter sp.]|nr:hypothetical protein [Methyloceanibacter sp.]